MAATLTLEEAQAHLAEVVGALAPGEEIVLTQNQRPVARLIGERGPERRQARVPGTCKGMITLFVQDEEHLQDFAEYMP